MKWIRYRIIYKYDYYKVQKKYKFIPIWFDCGFAEVFCTLQRAKNFLIGYKQKTKIIYDEEI